MIEIKFVNINFGVAPAEDDQGNQLKHVNLFHQESSTIYILPLSDDAAQRLSEDLALSNEDLMKKIEQDQMAQRLQIAKPGDIPPPNGQPGFDPNAS